MQACWPIALFRFQLFYDRIVFPPSRTYVWAKDLQISCSGVQLGKYGTQSQMWHQGPASTTLYYCHKANNDFSLHPIPLHAIHLGGCCLSFKCKGHLASIIFSWPQRTKLIRWCGNKKIVRNCPGARKSILKTVFGMRRVSLFQMGWWFRPVGPLKVTGKGSGWPIFNYILGVHITQLGQTII